MDEIGIIGRWQNRLASFLGVTPTQREKTVEELLHRPATERIAYWLQLVLAMGIATLGLVLGSTAVVIGAMLVSPLMGPILDLGMGLATGSPFLVLRSSSRALLSIVVVIAGSALIALLIPFHEVNAEIRARTAPNVLDLLIASFCALMGVYTTVRRGSDTASAAAGTSIGISLVPPLCVAGYGIGTLNEDVASGAGLLFVANFSAIVLVSTFSLLVLGYSRVGITKLERAELESDEQSDATVRRVARGLQGAFASRYGPLLRLAMPVGVIASVYFPLRQALEEVTWQVRVRTEVQAMVSSLSERVVQSALVVDRHAVALHLVIVGSPREALVLRERMDDEIRAIAGVAPTVEAIALPDAEAMEQLQSRLRLMEGSTPQTLAPVRPPLPRELGAAIADRWPAASAGPLVRATFEPEGDALVARVMHVGAELGPAGRELLARDIGSQLACVARVEETALPADTIAAQPGEEVAWLARASRVLEAMRGGDGQVRACVSEPPEPAPPSPEEGEETSEPTPPDPHVEAVRAALHDALDGRADATLSTGTRFELRLVTDDACPASTPPPAAARAPTPSATEE